MPLRSLQTRIVVFFVLLLCVVQGVAFVLISAANERIAKSQIAQNLTVGERVFRRPPVTPTSGRAVGFATLGLGEIGITSHGGRDRAYRYVTPCR